MSSQIILRGETMDLVPQRFQISNDETINYGYKIIVCISFLLLL